MKAAWWVPYPADSFQYMYSFGPLLIAIKFILYTYGFCDIDKWYNVSVNHFKSDFIEQLCVATLNWWSGLKFSKYDINLFNTCIWNQWLIYRILFHTRKLRVVLLWLETMKSQYATNLILYSHFWNLNKNNLPLSYLFKEHLKKQHKIHVEILSHPPKKPQTFNESTGIITILWWVLISIHWY